MYYLTTKIEDINRVGVTTAKRLKLLNIKTIQDLLYHFPFRYEDYSQITDIKDVQIGTSVNIIGQIELIQKKRSPHKKMYIVEALILDSNDNKIKAIWFNQPFIVKNIKIGDTVSLTGKISQDYTGPILKSPNYEKIYNKQTSPQGITPIYHLTANLTQKQISYLIKQVIDTVNSIEDFLPENIQKSQNFLSLPETIKAIHRPKDFNELEKARKRLAFDELFLTQLQSQIIKKDLKSNTSHSITFSEKETKKFVKSLPFKLTDDQKKSAWVILKDLEKSKPMSRLLEGDVGSGKTITSVIATLNVALNGYQSVIMVPTEILAIQHYESISKDLKDFNIEIGLFTRNKKIYNQQSTTKKKITEAIKNGAVDIIIGTHALIQETINFKNLALAIIDEQHRFGVEQRKTLINKSDNKNITPHLLSMTATPIPRSLALVIYGDLDISIIKEMPKNRKPIITNAVKENKRKEAYDFIRKEIKNGQQAFVVCPLIDESEKLEAKSVKEVFERLKKVFPSLKIAILHGKLKAKEKEKTMDDFLKNKINILVSTSVIEVGIDIPNSTIMLIEDADRFGLAQLHQFRGRVGRGKHQSYCFLFSDNNSEKVRERLSALEKYNNGLDLAKIDLKQRGPGEVYGINQKGFPEFKMANIFDHLLIKSAQDEAINLLKLNPNLENLPILKKRLDNWNKNIHLE
ncbi:ATP-dependent DNA helicase RecG [Candidatus Parcubacteria bacterium]|nr:ATP-dependent DNA helicase RecG [Candidatus Parcubacteria bacterium]